ncbi:MAG: hypothetical protein WKI04_16215 [Ferruginibacter sp.]
MEWMLFTWLLIIAITGLVAGLIFYKKNKALNKKIKWLKEQEAPVSNRWLS